MTTKELIRFFIPKFYNKVTWLIVSAGLSLLSKPLWIDILEAILQKELNITIPGVNDQLIGLIVIVIGLIYNVYMGAFSPSTIKKKEHDKLIFEKLDSILSESEIKNIWNVIIGSLMIRLNNNEKINSFIENGDEYRFLNKRIENRKKNLIVALDSLSDLISTDFFSHPNKSINDIICLRPDWDQEKTGVYNEELDKKFQKLRVELRKRVFKSEEEYKKFRSLVKNNLML